jgi:uncharacterized membrane protein YbhN (UPF0104 family)
VSHAGASADQPRTAAEVAGTPPELTTSAAATHGTVGKRLRRIGRLLLIAVVVGAIAELLGWDIAGWFSQLWDVVTGISVEYVIAALVLVTIQTTFTGAAWYGILRSAYGDDRVRLREILACYATGVALNSFVPANLGTLVCLLMFVAVIEGASFSGILGGYAVQKIFFTLAGAFVYVYLFLSVAGIGDIEFGWFRDHPGWTIGIGVGLFVLITAVIGVLRPKLAKFWEQAKQGGQVLVHPKLYFLRVFTPSLIGWLASIGVIAVMLAAYAIPVSFHVVMQVMGGNSIANVVSFTPGGVGVNQAANVASLNDVTDATTATAYSVAQQLLTTGWNLIFAIALVCWVFGWKGGRTLIGASYQDAKRQAAEQRAKRAAKHAAGEAEA